MDVTKYSIWEEIEDGTIENDRLFDIFYAYIDCVGREEMLIMLNALLKNEGTKHVVLDQIQHYIDDFIYPDSDLQRVWSYRTNRPAK